MSSITPTRTDFDVGVAEKLEELDDLEFADWWCVATRPFPCPAAGCDFVALHMTVAHLILVWPEADDPSMLYHAGLAKKVGRDPRVRRYEESFGPCISYDQHEAIGRPIHGKLDLPTGWDK